MSAIKIESSWKSLLAEEFEQPYFQKLKAFLVQEKQMGHTIYPKGSEIFAAFDCVPVSKLKVVILGQDPYHGANQAHGLSFSVNKTVPIPPSLQNIYKELLADFMGFQMPSHGDLHCWAAQGVLLLNATLTVRKDEPGSHQNQGWETFTDAVIKKISEQKTQVVFMLWGKFAQSKMPLIDAHKHLILSAAHPSPFSARNGFMGCCHFSKANTYLSSNGADPINWSVPNT